MDEDKKTLSSLRKIEKKLDILIALQKRATPTPDTGDEEKKILKLCDNKHTIDDIMNKTGKNRNTVKTTLFHLRNKGLIISVKTKDKKTVYERI